MMSIRPTAKAALLGLGVTVLAALASRVAPADQAANVVAALFVGATYFLVLNKSPDVVSAHGLSLGGVFDPTPLDPKRIATDIGRALAWALLFCALTFPLFWLGYRLWFGVGVAFHWALPSAFYDQALAQLLVIALPEEMFYRGYLQSALAAADGRTVKVFGARLGVGLLLSSAIFAFGHLLSTPHASRLAVFFPSLLFGWLRARTKGVGSGVIYHALCNLFSSTLAHGYGLVD
jgi:membrane protease YdiL (CAAX protease family)